MTTASASPLPEALARFPQTVRRDLRSGQRVSLTGNVLVSVIDRGALAVFVHAPGRSTFALEILGPGSILGISDQTEQRSADSWMEAVSLTATVTLQVPRNVFDHETAGDAGFAAAVSAAVGRQYRAMAEHRMLLQLRPGPRVASALLFLNRQLGGTPGGSPSLALTQDIVAATASLSRQTTNQTLRALQQSGALTVGRGQIVLRDPARLLDLATTAPATPSATR